MRDHLRATLLAYETVAADYETAMRDDLDRSPVDRAVLGLFAGMARGTVPDLPAAFAEVARVLAPGAPLVLSFQEGDRLRHVEHGYGHDVALDLHYRRPGTVAVLLADAGLDVVVTVRRELDPDERDPQAYLLARRRAA